MIKVLFGVTLTPVRQRTRETCFFQNVFFQPSEKKFNLGFTHVWFVSLSQCFSGAVLFVALNNYRSSLLTLILSEPCLL